MAEPWTGPCRRYVEARTRCKLTPQQKQFSSCCGGTVCMMACVSGQLHTNSPYCRDSRFVHVLPLRSREHSGPLSNSVREALRDCHAQALPAPSLCFPMYATTRQDPQHMDSAKLPRKRRRPPSTRPRMRSSPLQVDVMVVVIVLVVKCPVIVEAKVHCPVRFLHGAPHGLHHRLRQDVLSLGVVRPREVPSAVRT